MAEPAEVAARRGSKRRAKTDRADARHLRELLAADRLPEAWIPPAHVQQWRTRTRLRKTLVDERPHWLQPIQATLSHHGVPAATRPQRLLSSAGRETLERLALPEAARERIRVALALIDAIEAQPRPLERELRALARRQSGCRELIRRHFGIGELTAPTILVELGDVSRLSASRKAVRAVGLDIGVHRSDRRSRAGKLSKQGAPDARWAPYEAAQSACRATSPDHQAYLALRARGLSHTRASLTIARKLARRCFHTLSELGPAALEPITSRPRPPAPIATAQPHTHPIAHTLPARSLTARDRRPPTAVHKTPSGRPRPTRTDPSTMTPPTTQPSRTQVPPGTRAAIKHNPARRNHSPPHPPGDPCIR